MTVPFSATRMIPTGWSTRHAEVLPTSFNAAVTIGTRQGDATYDPGTDDTGAAYIPRRRRPSLPSRRRSAQSARSPVSPST